MGDRAADAAHAGYKGVSVVVREGGGGEVGQLLVV